MSGVTCNAGNEEGGRTTGNKAYEEEGGPIDLIPDLDMAK